MIKVAPHTNGEKMDCPINGDGQLGSEGEKKLDLYFTPVTPGKSSQKLKCKKENHKCTLGNQRISL